MQVFVAFDTVDGCVAANRGLAGRKFAQRVVVTSFFPDERFAHRDFA